MVSFKKKVGAKPPQFIVYDIKVILFLDSRTYRFLILDF